MERGWERVGVGAGAGAECRIRMGALGPGCDAEQGRQTKVAPGTAVALDRGTRTGVTIVLVKSDDECRANLKHGPC